MKTPISVNNFSFFFISKYIDRYCPQQANCDWTCSVVLIERYRIILLKLFVNYYYCALKLYYRSNYVKLVTGECLIRGFETKRLVYQLQRLIVESRRCLQKYDLQRNTFLQLCAHNSEYERARACFKTIWIAVTISHATTMQFMLSANCTLSSVLLILFLISIVTTIANTQTGEYLSSTWRVNKSGIDEATKAVELAVKFIKQL